MEAADALIDIAHNFGAVSAIELVKVVGTSQGISAVATDGRFDDAATFMARHFGDVLELLPTVVCYGRMFKTQAELVGCTVGLGRLPVLGKFDAFDKDSIRTLVHEFRSSGRVPTEIKFASESGANCHYRLMSGDSVNDFVNVPIFRGRLFEASFSPDDLAVKIFRKMTAEAAKSNIDEFWPAMNARGNVYFSFDQKPPSNDTVRFQVASKIPYVRLTPYTYPAGSVLEVLGLSCTAKSVTMGFSNRGVLKIDVVSAFGEYQFIFPGNRKLIYMWDQTDLYSLPTGIDALIREDKTMHCDWEPDLD